MTSRHLHELIDACRPGHEDIDLPEFSELAAELSQDPKLQRLFAQSQQLDAAIRTTFQSVTPPPGLAERLLEVIESASSEEGERTVAEVKSRVEPAKGSSRRSFATWAGVASLAAVAAVIALWFQLPEPVSTSDRDIAELVDRWNADLDLDQSSWQTTATIPTQDFPTWQHLKISRDDRWQWVSIRRIACYDFQGSGGTVRLFVMDGPGLVALPTAPPIGYPSPNGWHVGAWQAANGRVYYLAVKADGGSKDLYSDVIASSINPA